MAKTGIRAWGAVALLVVFLVGVVAWATGESHPRAAPSSESDTQASAPAVRATGVDTSAAPLPPNAAPPKPAPDEQPGKPQELPADPGEVDFFAGEMPDFMASLHVQVMDGKKLAAAQQKQLFEYGREHADDARPQLLLAWDCMQRGWQGIAVRNYTQAFHADPRAKDDPRMLPDLLDVIGRFDRVENREATALIQEAYGADAVPHVDERIAAMREARKGAAVARLEKLRAQLGG